MKNLTLLLFVILFSTSVFAQQVLNDPTMVIAQTTSSQNIEIGSNGEIDIAMVTYNFTSSVSSPVTIDELKFAASGTTGAITQIRIGSVVAQVVNGIAYLTQLNLVIPSGSAGLNVNVYLSYGGVGPNALPSGSTACIVMTYVKYTYGSITNGIYVSGTTLSPLMTLFPRDYLLIGGGLIVAGGHYSVPVMFSGSSVLIIEATLRANGLYFSLYDDNAVSVNEWPYQDWWPMVSFNKNTSSGEIRFGFLTNEPFGGKFEPMRIKFYSYSSDIDVTSAFMNFSVAEFTYSGYDKHLVETSTMDRFTVYGSNSGVFGGTDGLLDVVKILDISSGKIYVDARVWAFYDVNGDLTLDSRDGYLIMLKHFNQIAQYPVETGSDYWNGSGNVMPSGKIIAQQQTGQISLSLPANITNGDFKFKLPQGAWIEKRGDFSSINKVNGKTILSFINNSGNSSSVIIHGVKNLSEIVVEGSINNGIPITVTQSGTTAVEESSVPKKFELAQNYPNPFNPSTTISYQLPSAGNVTLKIYDIIGQEVATLVNEEKVAGSYSVNFDASKLSSGVYIYKISAGNFTQAKKMILTK